MADAGQIPAPAAVTVPDVTGAPPAPLPELQPHHDGSQPQQQQSVNVDDVVKLFGYFTSEFRGFLAHVEHAVQTFQTTGLLPTQPLYRAQADNLPAVPQPEGAVAHHPGPGRPRKIRRDRIVRKPTPFNHFVKEKIRQFKAEGVVIEDDRNGNEMFKKAVAEWSAMTPEQKKAYGDEYRLTHPEAAADAGPDSGSAAGEPATAEQAQLLLHGANAASGAKRKVQMGAAQLPPPGADLGVDEHISLTELVTGGEEAEAGIAAAAPTVGAEDEPGRKKRKGASVKSKP